MKMDNTDVEGVTANFADVRNINVAQGRFINEADDQHHSEVVFIGADVAKKFFSNVDPIGKTISAETHSYQVIGVAEAIGSAFGQSQDNFMIMPLGTYYKEWHRQSDWLTIFVQAPSAEMMSATEDEARMLMRAWRHLPYDAKDNFAILGSDSIMRLWHDLTGNLAFVAVLLVSVFLVVGGIVIMNIMLASVTERTREIGIRRSLGRAQGAHFVSVRDRIGGTGDARWFIGRDSGVCGGSPRPRSDCDSHGNTGRRGVGLPGSLDRCGTFLWNLSGDEGGKAGSDRSVAGRRLRSERWHRPTAKI